MDLNEVFVDYTMSDCVSFSGFYETEDKLRYTGSAAIIKFDEMNRYRECLICMNFFIPSFIEDFKNNSLGSPTITVNMNIEPVAIKNFFCDQHGYFIVCKFVFENETPLSEIKINCNAFIPDEIIKNGDNRSLGIAFKQLRIYDAPKKHESMLITHEFINQQFYSGFHEKEENCRYTNGEGQIFVNNIVPDRSYTIFMEYAYPSVFSKEAISSSAPIVLINQEICSDLKMRRVKKTDFNYIQCSQINFEKKQPIHTLSIKSNPIIIPDQILQNGDKRSLGIGLKNIKIVGNENIEKKEELTIDYKFDKNPFFSGFYEPEGGFRFSDGNGCIYVDNLRLSKEYKIYIDYLLPCLPQNKEPYESTLNISINEGLEYKLMLQSSNPDFGKTFIFSFNKKTPIYKINILSKAHHLKNQSAGDKRLLGIAIKKIKIVSIRSEGNPKLKNFCIAPWIEGVLRNNGDLKPCCRNTSIMGDWQREGLKNVWNSDAYKFFRDQIHRGIFPNKQCKECYYDGSIKSITKFQWVYYEYRERLYNILIKKKKLTNNDDDDDDDQLNFFKADYLLDFFQSDIRVVSNKSQENFSNYFSDIKKLIETITGETKDENEAKLLLEKLLLIGRSLEDYIVGNLMPYVVAPSRQIELIGTCNARCIHCRGFHSGEIENGKSMNDKYLNEAFFNSEQILRFFMNGTEFLLYKNWKKILNTLKQTRSRIDISTNGILLTTGNIRYLIDNCCVSDLSISIDGATQKTVESIRVNVIFKKLAENIAFLLNYAHKKKSQSDISFSFVLMKRNFHELATLIRLVYNLADKKKDLLRKTKISVRPLEFYSNSNSYKKFYNIEHHSKIDKTELNDAINDALIESKRSTIKVYIFEEPISDFVESGFILPEIYNNSPTKQKQQIANDQMGSNYSSLKYESSSLTSSGKLSTGRIEHV